LVVDANGNVVRAANLDYQNTPTAVIVNKIAGSGAPGKVKIIAEADLPMQFGDSTSRRPPAHDNEGHRGDVDMTIEPRVTGNAQFNYGGFDRVTVTNDSSKQLVINNIDMLTSLGGGNPNFDAANIIRKIDGSDTKYHEHRVDRSQNPYSFKVPTTNITITIPRPSGNFVVTTGSGRGGLVD
jgi:hypothetical protein